MPALPHLYTMWKGSNRSKLDSITNKVKTISRGDGCDNVVEKKADMSERDRIASLTLLKSRSAIRSLESYETQLRSSELGRRISSPTRNATVERRLDCDG